MVTVGTRAAPATQPLAPAEVHEDGSAPLVYTNPVYPHDFRAAWWMLSPPQRPPGDALASRKAFLRSVVERQLLAVEARKRTLVLAPEESLAIEHTRVQLIQNALFDALTKDLKPPTDADVERYRRQKTELLCARDDKHHSRTCAPVKRLAAAAMARVNSGVGAASQSPTVSEFWERTYLPFAEKNLRPSTVGSYKDLWTRHLKPHFDSARLGEYRSSNATEFLTKLAERLSRNPLNHVRSLMSGIFSHACALGIVA